MEQDTSNGEALRRAQKALEDVTVDDLQEKDAEWVESAYMTLDAMSGEYE